ncbi:MAG: hypothetical protein GY679_02045 [Mycoplasma sp.]|nr:hypothetical protein [Mycoplasma sp.]
MKKIIILLMVALTSCQVAQTQQSSDILSEVYVKRVIDGDTIVLNNDMRVRLYGIDAPEISQSFGLFARDWLKRTIEHKTVTLEQKGFDRYGRMIAIVKTKHANINETLVYIGLAWVYERYCDEPYKQKWISFQKAAKKYRRGVFSEPLPIPPWEFRKQNR